VDPNLEHRRHASSVGDIAANLGVGKQSMTAESRQSLVAFRVAYRHDCRALVDLVTGRRKRLRRAGGVIALAMLSVPPLPTLDCTCRRADESRHASRSNSAIHARGVVPKVARNSVTNDPGF
jgi:hypothetical protein